MIRAATILVFIICFLITQPCLARPLPGFNKGPYLTLTGGITQVDFDKDEYDNVKIGRSFEPAVGIKFGWNIWDWFSTELSGSYGTNINAGRREHIVDAGLAAKGFLIMDALTDFKSLRILPALKGGLTFRIASLPGNQNTTDSVVTTFGWGPSAGGGVWFLLKKYISFGFEVTEDFLFFDDTRQNLTVNGQSLPNTMIYKGGFIPQFSAIGFIGVHY